MTNVLSMRWHVPDDLSSIVKPEELVDIIEMTHLTLNDRRIYNLLIGNAWNSMFEKKVHEISRSEITQYVDSNNQDIAASLRRLMSAIVVIKIRNNKNGRPSTRQMQLLGTNDIEDRGPIQYSFPTELVSIIEKTEIFARLHTKVMFELTSKYSLALYEFLQKRYRLDYKNSETMTVEEARGFLGVPKGKLTTFGHFNKYALQVATREVSFLAEYDVRAEAVKTSRAVTHVRFIWEKKQDVGDQIAAVEELERSKIGRKARMTGQVVQISDAVGDELSQKTDSSVDHVPTISSSQKTDSSQADGDAVRPWAALSNTEGVVVSEEMLLWARRECIKAGTGWDVYEIARQFEAFANKSGAKVINVEKAWEGFALKKIKKRA